MSELVVNGKRRLEGEICVHGAKNSALPILAAALICDGKCVLKNCPGLSDVDIALDILRQLGCGMHREADVIEIDSTSAYETAIPDELMRKMRSSIVFLGAIISKSGRASMSYPGGCELGPRPIDIHIAALKKLGIDVDERFGQIECRADGGVRGTTLNLPFPSVGATENIMLAAVKAVGVTKIHNAAREPEICDLADFLNKCGADIIGAGSDIITINGVKSLHGCEHTVIPDRIEAATYMAAAAVTGSALTLSGVRPEHIEPVFFAFREAGCDIEAYENKIKIIAPRRLGGIRLVRTLVYPGFPTDALSPVMAMAAVAEGSSMFIETIFQNRFKQAGELIRLGANIKIEGRVAVVDGVESLYGTTVTATDLRGGAALVTAALAADGETRISDIYHIDRGYEKIEDVLAAVGADIKREG